MIFALLEVSNDAFRFPANSELKVILTSSAGQNIAAAPPLYLVITITTEYTLPITAPSY